jgi:hypothetical protein
VAFIGDEVEAAHGPATPAPPPRLLWQAPRRPWSGRC